MNILNKKIEKYQTFLNEKYRPPSKGGNTKALHSHVITINDVKYSFLAFGSKKWIFKHDTVSFEYSRIVIKNEEHFNIDENTIVTLDIHGIEQIRGIRGYKKKIRTADTRMPVSKREMNK